MCLCNCVCQGVGMFLSCTHVQWCVHDRLQNRGASNYYRFEAADFKPSETEFNLQLADNQFSTQTLKLNLPNIQGTLTFHNPIPWTKMLGAPGIMGWFGFVPFMECYHGVVSLNHTISGSLNINGEDVSFDGGCGYIEKDWGISFPRGWIWLQTNHFFEKTDEPQTQRTPQYPISLIASVAHIPFLGTHFIGYIVGFWYNNKLHRFATHLEVSHVHILISHTGQDIVEHNSGRACIAR